MSTAQSTPPVTPPPVTTPAHPAKGNQRGQTTLAAEIDRWQAMANNLAPQIDQMPGLQDSLAQLQTLLAAAKDVRNQINALRANLSTAMTVRDQLLGDGEGVFARLSLGLQGIHGPRSPHLREFGLKPRGLRTGRPRKRPLPAEPTAVEVAPSSEE